MFMDRDLPAGPMNCLKKKSVGQTRRDRPKRLGLLRREAPRMSKPLSSTPIPADVDVSSGDTQEWINRRATEQATRAANARQLSGRRRFIDPTTCEREYTEAEMEFMMAMNEYKRKSGRMFPTWSEVLEVVRSLGYEKIDDEPVPEPEPVKRAAKSALVTQ
jgi:hypothetical protein